MTDDELREEIERLETDLHLREIRGEKLSALRRDFDRLPSDPSPGRRRFCYRCFKPDLMCICADIRPVSTRFRLLILQHPREFRRTISTARIVSLSVPGSELIVGVRFQDHSRLARLLDPATGPAYLLFPQRGAPEAAELARREHGWPGAAPLFVLLDGTWDQARKIRSLNPMLAALPPVSLRSDEPSRYVIRRQPRPGCLSTVEAAALLLSRLEPFPAAGQPMLETFHRMMDRMLPFKRRCATRGERAPAPRPGPAPPPGCPV